MESLARELTQRLATLRQRVVGVAGGVVGGTDGLLLGQEGAIAHDPHDLAALAAAGFGLGRQTAIVLEQGQLAHVVINSDRGSYLIYAINDTALLGIVATPGLNLAQLNIEARAAATELDQLLGASLEVIRAGRL